MRWFSLRTIRPGFTLIELLVVITIIGILAAIALPNYIRAKDKAKEVQAKASLKSIQVAVERYAVDHEKYPPYLLGGDVEGWASWHQKYDEASNDRLQPLNKWVTDPLIENGYLSAYPENPFTDNGNALIAQTGLPTGGGGVHQPGDGDPRFGFRGTLMGNGLDDPAWTLYRISGLPPAETSRIEISRTLQNWDQLGFVRYDNGTMYAMSGRVIRESIGTGNLGGGQPILDPDGNIQFAYTVWPGNYFYRGLFDIPVLRKGYTHYDPGSNPGTEINRYMMGVYGSFQSTGSDCIRTETRDFNGNRLWYHQPPPWEWFVSDPSDIYCGWSNIQGQGLGMPEVCGGGNAFDGPVYPYDFPNGDYGEYLYGAPDGVSDGVILILTPGADGLRAQEK